MLLKKQQIKILSDLNKKIEQMFNLINKKKQFKYWNKNYYRNIQKKKKKI